MTDILAIGDKIAFTYHRPTMERVHVRLEVVGFTPAGDVRCVIPRPMQADEYSPAEGRRIIVLKRAAALRARIGV